VKNPAQFRYYLLYKDVSIPVNLNTFTHHITVRLERQGRFNFYYGKHAQRINNNTLMNTVMHFKENIILILSMD
jgi:hypothetical protein